MSIWFKKRKPNFFVYVTDDGNEAYLHLARDISNEESAGLSIPITDKNVTMIKHFVKESS